MGTSYYLSMQLEPGAQSVRFVPSRSRNKKKMLINAASCCSTSAEEVVPPSARGTRAVQTPQKGRQATSQPSSSRALKDEPDPNKPGLHPPLRMHQSTQQIRLIERALLELGEGSVRGGIDLRAVGSPQRVSCRGLWML
ncbi:hypothetical protein C2S51_026169 [Perilla frutescens var. frutescens]|nr:hypothetical protein C2S51_026169 [Perilla frutescens var. frutescens]